ncbi:DUF4910 domain-containing protein [Candidatus Bipolaricaulota bacterium]
MYPDKLMGNRTGAMVRFFQEKLDGNRAIADIRNLTTWNRTPGSRGYRLAAKYVVNALKEAGLQDVAIHDFPMDGQSEYRGWAADPAWDVTRAEIRMISPIERPLANRDIEPIAVHQGSWPTPEDGVVARLITVGEGSSASDYSDESIQGCVVLSSGPTQRVYEEAVVKRGAIGILSHHMPWQCPEVDRTPAQLPDLVSQGKIRVQLDDKARGFAFSVSYRQASELKELLEQSDVTVQCWISGGPTAGSLDVVSGLIPGTEYPKKEFIVVGHLCHPSPGANDNASGVGLGLELARCLASAQRHERLGAPRYSIRFVFSPEIIGPLAYLSLCNGHVDHLIGGVNIDMVGTSQFITRSPLLLENTPWSLPTYAFDLADLLLSYGKPSAKDGQWAHKPVPFEGGSDNIVFNDSTVGAPMVGFGYRADPCYHSNLDVWTNMDADVLANVGLAAGGLVWAAAWMDAEIADEALSIVSAARRNGASDTPYAVSREVIESVRRRTLSDPQIDAVVEKHLSQLDGSERSIAEPTPVTEDALILQGLSKDAHPLRVVQSLVWPPINGTGGFLASLPADHALKQRMSGYDYIETYQRIYEILNLCDGDRSWFDIHRLVTTQFQGTTNAEVSRLARLLIDAGAIQETEGNGK